MKALRLLSSYLVISCMFISCGISDSTIQQSVNAAIQSNQSLADISASVNDGSVLLKGNYADETARLDGNNIIAGIEGVKAVIDSATITVIPIAPSTAALTDSTLQIAVDSVLKRFKGVHATVKNGNITLTGTIIQPQLKWLISGLNRLHPANIINSLNYTTGAAIVRKRGK
ncbi:BON domain-containing protein [Limnovirga soli]|uniref:BON domain-containing protein n=1 Tax=Limnovirga soli TaxID=2656915 RepID=A0A8J8FDJ5_9BACT|nr:BON domain-containing protein [Limnovirga soli]NNV54434.1 BON domain-containing protein [Limnovirga soli]